MDNRVQNIKKVYTETASAIFKLHSKNMLSEEEMGFLLNFLDLVIKQKNKELVNIVRDWLERDTTTEIDEIIKATLFNLDLSDSSSLAHSIELIEELLLSCPETNLNLQ
jgi:16S rRNA A1518/A1519 N6-dimethyltransferase RsmA/KsgA/DIM1 with predicted DNA glycosylase/AP lyase activity